MQKEEENIDMGMGMLGMGIPGVLGMPGMGVSGMSGAGIGMSEMKMPGMGIPGGVYPAAMQMARSPPSSHPRNPG